MAEMFETDLRASSSHSACSRILDLRADCSRIVERGVGVVTHQWSIPMFNLVIGPVTMPDELDRDISNVATVGLELIVVTCAP